MTEELACVHKKAVFDSEEAAVEGADRANRKYGSNNLKPYLCPGCGYYHLTSLTVRHIWRGE